MWHFILLFVLQVAARTVTYNWDVDWVSVSPDGLRRPAVGINGQWPCPPLHVNIGDRVVINVHNSLGNETTTVHFHGIFQSGSTQMDGPAMVSQCPIQPGGSKLDSIPCDKPKLTKTSAFTYDFTVGIPKDTEYHELSLTLSDQPTGDLLVSLARWWSIYR